MQGIKVIALPCNANLLPNFATLNEFGDFVKENKITLIIDKTYRDFISDRKNLHNLFLERDWRQWLTHLYSFSKVYRIS